MAKKEADVKKEVEVMFNAYVSIFRNMGTLSASLGQIEEKNEKAFSLMRGLSEEPDKMNQLISQLPSDIIGDVFKVFVNINQTSERVKNLMNLSAKDKVKLGTDLQQLADRLEEISKRF